MFKARFKLILLLVAVMVLAIISMALAAGNFPWTKNKQLAPNVTAIAPEKGQSGCVTQAITKGTFGTYTSMEGYLSYDAEVTTAAGAAEPVKWELDGTHLASGPSFKFTNTGASTYKRAVQRVYSAASRSLSSCVRRQ